MEEATCNTTEQEEYEPGIGVIKQALTIYKELPRDAKEAFLVLSIARILLDAQNQRFD